MNSIEILYEDNHLIAVNKKIGDIVQGDKTGDEPLVEKVRKYIKEKYNKPGEVFCGLIHRVDRPVSGIVLFAKTGKALTRMNEMFQSHDLLKRYYAIVKDTPNPLEARITHYLVRTEKNNKSTAHIKEVPNSKKSTLSYRVVGKSDKYTLVEVDLETGRHHQIRCQLAKIGCPIKGDLKYGAPRSNKDGGISLHAGYLEFIHPVKKEKICIRAPFPKGDLFEYMK